MLLLLSSTFASYNCRTPENCMVIVIILKRLENKNAKKYQLDSLFRDNGNCYFHNTVTREDTDLYPLGGKNSKNNIINYLRRFYFILNN